MRSLDGAGVNVSANDSSDKKLSGIKAEVLLNAQTEVPGTGRLLHNKKDGTYSCSACKSTLFESGTKYDSGSGWPAFYDAVEGAISTKKDTSHGMVRTEITCSNCGGHLGHTFDVPDTPTGKWHCVNSAAMTFTGKDGKVIDG